MKIQNTGSEIYRSGYASGIRGGAVEGSTAGRSDSVAVSGGRGDRVEISQAGRALAAQGSSELSPERVAHIRQRILEGAYDSAGMVEEVARRMLQSGDI